MSKWTQRETMHKQKHSEGKQAKQGRSQMEQDVGNSR